jgi:pimeloyl-ACP methyl ester carboxylesterase
MIDDPRGPIEYDETGEGPTVVLVPGSCSTGAAWRPLIAQWQGAYRCVTTSLLGYGRTAERRTPDNNDVALEADIIEAVIARAGAPVHLVGHSFGGLSALAVALRRPELLQSLTILESPAPEILKACRERAHYAAFRSMTELYFNAFRSGRKDAIQSMIDFYGGDGTFSSWPERVRDYAIATTEVNIRDWACAYDFALTPEMLARVATPTLVVYGETSHPAPKRANELLGWSMPNADIMMLGDAAHFMIATHPRQLAALLTRHFAGARSLTSPRLRGEVDREAIG